MDCMISQVNDLNHLYDTMMLVGRIDSIEIFYNEFAFLKIKRQLL